MLAIDDEGEQGVAAAVVLNQGFISPQAFLQRGHGGGGGGHERGQARLLLAQLLLRRLHLGEGA